MYPMMQRPHSETTAYMTAGLNLIQQAISIYDSDLCLVSSNRRFKEMFDLPDALVAPGRPFSDTVRYLVDMGEYGPVTEKDAFVAERVAQAQTFEPHYLERTRANGRTISVEGSPLPQGGWVAVYTDITEDKRKEALLRTRSEQLSEKVLIYAEELSSANRELSATITALEEAKREISEAEARMRLTAEMMPAHLAHVDREKRYTYSNRKLTTIMPGSRPDLIGQHMSDVLGPETFEQILPHLDKAFNGEPTVFELTHEPSTRRVRIALTPDPADGGVYLMTMDVTEETQTRTMLQQTRRRAMAAQLTSGLAHDFSNLLTIILALQSRLQKGTLSTESQEIVAATITAAHRGGNLLDRIANLISTREFTPKPVNLNPFLWELKTLANSVLPKEISFEINNLIGHPNVMLDPDLLQDALLNLVINARDATFPSGVITLTIHEVRNTWLEFTVTDTGGGFSERALEHAIEPFFTTKGSDGSGLGLSMVYDMTKLAGGRMRISNCDTGARVEIRLPLRLANALNSGPHLILLVEDSHELRQHFRDMLRELGHSVVEATSGAEALLLLTELPEISVILSDVKLSGELTGVDLLNSSLSHNRASILMTSLRYDDPLYQKALDRAPVLRKPFDLKQLKTALQFGPTS